MPPLHEQEKRHFYISVSHCRLVSCSVMTLTCDKFNINNSINALQLKAKLDGDLSIVFFL